MSGPENAPRSGIRASRVQQSPARHDQAVAQAKPLDEPISDWQVFTLLGGAAGGMLTLGIAALYGLSLLLS